MRGTAAEPRILKALAGLGTEDGVRPKSIRTPELCRLTGITANNLGRAIQPLIDQGKVIMCKITRPGPGGSVKEFRLGAGMVQAGQVPLNPRRAGIAHGAPTKPLPVTTPAPKVSTPAPDVCEIPVPVFKRAHPAVASNSGSSATGSPTTTPSPGVPAVAAKATPKPTRHSPAAASEGDVRLRLSIDQDGALQIGDDDDPARYIFNPEHTLAIGDFLHLTQGVWRP